MAYEDLDTQVIFNELSEEQLHSQQSLPPNQYWLTEDNDEEIDNYSKIFYATAKQTTTYSYTTTQWSFHKLPLSTLTKKDDRSIISLSSNQLSLATSGKIIVSAEVNFYVNKACVMYLVVQDDTTALSSTYISCSAGNHKIYLNNLVVDVDNPTFNINFSCNTASVSINIFYTNLSAMGVEQ